AGPVTPLVRPCVHWFYRYRHLRWRRVAKRLAAAAVGAPTPRRQVRPRGLLPALLVAAWPPPAAPAARGNLPVVRDAPERWRWQTEDECYRLTVVHRGPLAEADRKTLDWLRALGDDQKPLANVAVEAVDLDEQTDAATHKLWLAQPKPSLPWLV